MLCESIDDINEISNIDEWFIERKIESTYNGARIIYDVDSLHYLIGTCMSDSWLFVGEYAVKYSKTHRTYKKYMFGLCSKDKEFVEATKTAFETIFPFKLEIKLIKKKCQNNFIGYYYEIRCYRKKIVEYLLSQRSIVQSKILKNELTIDEQKSVLKGMFDGDGSISLMYRNKKNTYELVMQYASKFYYNEFESLLRSLEIPYRKYDYKLAHFRFHCSQAEKLYSLISPLTINRKEAIMQKWLNAIFEKFIIQIKPNQKMIRYKRVIR